MKITKEYLETIEWLEHCPADEYRMMAVLNNPDFTEFQSKDELFTICNVANLSADAWHIHLDNSDFDTLVSFDAETVEEVNTILNIYNKYTSNQFIL
jgi:hypothetical protein